MFPKEFRLSNRKDVDFVMKRGDNIHSKRMVVWFLLGPIEHHRVTVIVGKKCEKSAVKRNLIKRRVREAIRTLLKENFDNFPKVDIIFWLRHENEADSFDYHEAKKEVEENLGKIARIASKPDFGKIKFKTKIKSRAEV